MTENNAINEIIKEVCSGCYGSDEEPQKCSTCGFKVAKDALKEIQAYRAMEQRLQKVYGECDGLLEKVVQHLENHENIELPDNIIKARLLTDEDVDKWEAYRAIGTVEEFKALKEKAEAKKPIPLDKWGEYHKCPVCGKYAENSYGCKYLYCPNCGCKYDWSE